MGACASAIQAHLPKKQESNAKKSPAETMKEVTQTISGFIKEMVKMGVTCFPAADLAMALPAYTWDLEKANSFDYSKPSKKGVNPKTAFSATDQAMAILSSLAYMKGAEGEIKAMLFDASTMHPLLQKNAGAELAARGVKLSEASFAQLASYKSEKGKPCWFSAADEANKVVYVVIRGTDSINDILSDLNIQTADVSICGASAKVHSGINESALFVLDNCKSHIAPYLEKGFSLVFTGHSLGAGTAALAASHARSQGGNGYSAATAVTFACPGIISAKNADGSKSAPCKAMKTFVTTHVLGFDIVPRASGHAIFTLLDSIFSNNWKEKTKKRLEEEAKKKLGAHAGAMGSMMSKVAAAAPEPTAEEIAATEAEAKRVVEEIAKGREKIREYPHILPGGKLRHLVKIGDSKETFNSKKKRFHEVILSAQELGAIFAHHSMDQYLDFMVL